MTLAVPLLCLAFQLSPPPLLICGAKSPRAAAPRAAADDSFAGEWAMDGNGRGKNVEFVAVAVDDETGSDQVAGAAGSAVFFQGAALA